MGDTNEQPGQPFLTAEWRNLLVINWEVKPELLADHVPRGTALDDFEGSTYVSLVGFIFASSRLWGVLPLPFLSSFEEVNLRFYVRREDAAGLRRGVSFIRETVPSRIIAATARGLYSEPYVRRRMTHTFKEEDGKRHVSYGWLDSGEWLSMAASTSQPPRSLSAGSFEEFILEHYWGYTRLSHTKTGEYRVGHPPWEFMPLDRFQIELGDGRYYGSHFSGTLRGTPHSAFLAVGSAIQIHPGRYIDTGS